MQSGEQEINLQLNSKQKLLRLKIKFLNVITLINFFNVFLQKLKMPRKNMSTPKRGKKTTSPKKEPVEEEEETMAKIEQYMEETNVSIRPSS